MDRSCVFPSKYLRDTPISTFTYKQESTHAVSGYINGDLPTYTTLSRLGDIVVGLMRVAVFVGDLVRAEPYDGLEVFSAAKVAPGFRVLRRC